MRFAYQTHILEVGSDEDPILLARPEIPVTLVGPNGRATLIGLVDTGSDYTVFPRALALDLGIELIQSRGASASAFGGAALPLVDGVASLRIEDDEECCEWRAELSFFEFSARDETAVILGHAGFLEFFTAVFDGDELLVALQPNQHLPPAQAQ